MNTKLGIVILAVVVIGGGGGFGIYKGLVKSSGKEKLVSAGSQRQMSQPPGGENMGIVAPPSESTEKCSPPGTPTCSPSGHVVGGNTASGPGQGAPGQGGSTVEKLSEDVGLKKIALSGDAPQGLDIDLKTGLVYIGNNGNVIAGCEGDVTRQASSGGLTPVNNQANSLSIVDPAIGKETAKIDTEAGAIWTQVDNKNNVVYVAGSGNGKIGVHELGSGKKKSAITVGGKPHAFAYSPDSGVLIISNTNDDTQTYASAVSTVTGKVLSAYKSPELPHGISIDEAKGVAYMVGVKNGDIAVIDMKTGQLKEIKSPLGGKANNSNMMAFSAKKRLIFISDTQTQSSITVINADTWKEVGKITFGNQSLPAWGMQVDDEFGLLYAALPQANGVGVVSVDTLKPVGLVPVDTCPYAVRLDTQRGLGYTTSITDNTLSVFDLNKVQAQVK